MNDIPEVANSPPQINTAEFVKLTIYNDYSNTANVSVYTFSSAYKNETIDGDVYLALGGFLGVGVQNKDIRITSSDTGIALSGISGNNIVVVLGAKIRGSEVEIKRGFYNSDYTLGNVYPRFKGVVTNYAITNDREDVDDTFTVTITASSYKLVLQNRIAGRYTNKESWRYWNANDASMDNVYSIAGRTFDFGKPVTAIGGGSPFIPGGPGNNFNKF